MESGRDKLHSGSQDASHQNNETESTGINPQNTQRSNAGGLSLNRNRRGQTNPVNQSRGVRLDTNLTNVPNFRFRSLQQTSNPSPTLQANDSNSCDTQSSSSNIRADVIPGSRDVRARNRPVPLPRVSTRGASPKRQSGTSPRRNNGRGGNNNSTSHRQRGTNAARARTDEGMVEVEIPVPNQSRGSLTMLTPGSDNDIIDLRRWRNRGASSSVDDLVPPLYTNAASGVEGISGLGTEDQPFELNDTDTSDLEASAALARDEEFARQLQQEEWERATTPVAVGFRTPPTRFQFLQAVHGALGGDRPEYFPPRRVNNMVRLPGLRSTRGSMPQAAMQFPDLLEFFHPQIMEVILGNGPLLEENDYEELLEIGEQIGAVSRGLSQADINKIPVKKHRVESTSVDGATPSQGDQPQCSICLSEFANGDSKRILPCEHQLHKGCVDQWLKTNATCPVCRKDVREEREGRT